jgi:hypothetical protein
MREEGRVSAAIDRRIFAGVICHACRTPKLIEHPQRSNESFCYGCGYTGLVKDDEMLALREARADWRAAQPQRGRS